MRKKVFIAVVLLGIILGSVTDAYSFGLSSKKAKAGSVKAYDNAHELYLKEKYADAEKLYKEFVKNYPKSLLVQPALFYTAKCAAEEKKYNEAMNYYKQLIADYKEGFWVKTAKDEMVKIRAIQKEK